MKRVLVVYYTQTGQLKEIVDSLTAPLEADPGIELHYERIRPANDFPFPWSGMDFFEAFPESVQEVPSALEPFTFDPETAYDLIILAYQPWFLSPSIPMSSFLQSPEAQQVMEGRPVLSISGSRNMWITAQEKLKKRIASNGGTLVGNIALVDRHSNLISLVTILGWLLKGKREGLMGIFPRSGVSKEDVEAATRFGRIVRDRLPGELDPSLQKKLLDAGAVRILPNLMILEKRGSRAFEAFSKFIRKKGGPGSPGRRARLRLFASLLFPVLIILSPITTLSSYMILLIRRKWIKREIHYHSGVSMERNESASKVGS